MSKAVYVPHVWLDCCVGGHCRINSAFLFEFKCLQVSAQFVHARDNHNRVGIDTRPVTCGIVGECR